MEFLFFCPEEDNPPENFSYIHNPAYPAPTYLYHVDTLFQF